MTEVIKHNNYGQGKYCDNVFLHCKNAFEALSCKIKFLINIMHNERYFKESDILEVNIR